MRKSFLLLLLSAVVPGFCLEPARGQGLVIRVVDRAAIPHETLRGAIVQADMVFQKAKVDVDWVSCSATDPSNACNLSSSDPQLVIIIIPHPTRDTPSSPGAFAIADRRINAAFVFYDRVSDSALVRDYSCAPVLASVMAHEAAHLLGLDHSGGIMRKRFGPEDLAKAVIGLLLFDESQAIQLRRAATAGMQKGQSRGETASLDFVQTNLYMKGK
jgi:hypothetical protein